MNGRKAKERRRREREEMADQLQLGLALEDLDVWKNPETGEIFFAAKEEIVEEEERYPEDNSACTNCGKRQNETHWVPVQKSGIGGFFICDDNVTILAGPEL